MGGHGVNLNQLHYHNLASFECVVLVGQVRPKFSCYINLSVYICICISINDPSSTYLFVYPQLRICLYKGIAKENLRGGWNPQNMRTRKGSRVLMGWREVWGTTSENFLISMLFYLFLHQYFSIFVILNHFFIIFLLFSYLFHQFWVFTAHPSQGLYARGGGGSPTCAATLLCLYIFRFIYSSVHLSTVHIILILYLSLPIFPSFYLFICHLSIYTFLFCIIRFRM